MNSDNNISDWLIRVLIE